MALERVGTARRELGAVRFEAESFGWLWLAAEDLPDLGESPVPVKGYSLSASDKAELADAGVLDVVGRQARLLVVDSMEWFSVPLRQLLDVVAGKRKGAMISLWKPQSGGAPSTSGSRPGGVS